MNCYVKRVGDSDSETLTYFRVRYWCCFFGLRSMFFPVGFHLIDALAGLGVPSTGKPFPFR
jgi:hypothetical protein